MLQHGCLKGYEVFSHFWLGDLPDGPAQCHGLTLKDMIMEKQCVADLIKALQSYLSSFPTTIHQDQELLIKPCISSMATINPAGDCDVYWARPEHW
jgi:hypothetical protein